MTELEKSINRAANFHISDIENPDEAYSEWRGFKAGARWAKENIKKNFKQELEKAFWQGNDYNGDPNKYYEFEKWFKENYEK